MSFFCNFQSDKCPGVINGNPLNGLCEKACIQTRKVFDACMKQMQLDNATVKARNSAKKTTSKSSTTKKTTSKTTKKTTTKAKTDTENKDNK